MKEIELSKKGWKNKGKYKALVDDDVFEEVNRYNWTYTSNGYARNKKMTIYLHRFIWELKNGNIPEGLDIEHWDENKLNCQISNLRLATRSENCCNVTKRKNNKSGYKGVSKHVYRKERKDGTYKEYTKWTAEIGKGRKRHAKEFPYTEEGLQQAIDWYKEMSLKLQTEFSIFNKPKK